MRHSMAWPSRRISSWLKASFMPAATRICHLTRSMPGDHLGDRVLHLQAGVHLHKIELPVLDQQKFDGAQRSVIRPPWQPWPPPRSSCSRVRRPAPVEGHSSISFWFLRWMEHSRSPRQTTLPCASQSSCTSMCLAVVQELFHVDRRRRQRRAEASREADAGRRPPAPPGRLPGGCRGRRRPRAP